MRNNNTIDAKILKLLLYRIARRSDAGGRGRMFTAEQETHIVNMVAYINISIRHTLLHSWTPYMTYSLMFRDQSRPDTSSYGTMLVSIGLLWSATGLQITHSSLYSTSPHTLHS